MAQAIASEKKNGTGQGKLFGIFHISAFDMADAPGQIKQAAQDAKDAVGNASSEPPVPSSPPRGLPCRHAWRLAVPACMHSFAELVRAPVPVGFSGV